METLQENGNYILAEKDEKSSGEKCLDEVKAILEKYNCQLICVPQMMYGQRIFVPIIEEKK